jgi:transcriptional regulator with XRE-family HTH domain
MRERQRIFKRRELEEELRYFRMAAKRKNNRDNLLRAVRHVMGIPMKEIAQKMGVNRSVIFRMEKREELGTISLNNMERVANAMGFELTYGIVPRDGETLEHLASRRLWERLLGKDRG